MKKSLLKLSPKKLKAAIEIALNCFYDRRIAALDKLNFSLVLQRKNPYLFKATGRENAVDLVKSILFAYSSSSEEGIFGKCFFEAIAQKISGGKTPLGGSGDIQVEEGNLIKIYAVKSGPNVFNSSSKRDQIDAFRKAQRVANEQRRHFEAIVGYGYGRRESKATANKPFREISGQAFWEELTGDSEFYIGIVELMNDLPRKHLPQYEKAFDAVLNRFVRDFTSKFCDRAGHVNWPKLIAFNSGKKKNKSGT